MPCTLPAICLRTSFNNKSCSSTWRAQTQNYTIEVVERNIPELAHLHKIKHKKTKAASDEGGSNSEQKRIQFKSGCCFFFSPRELTGKK